MLCTRAIRVATRSFPSKPAFIPQFHLQLRFGCSLSTNQTRMAPKYLTGDKAGIDAFVDQFDVSLHWHIPKMMVGILTCKRFSCLTAMVRFTRYLRDWTNMPRSASGSKDGTAG